MLKQTEFCSTFGMMGKTSRREFLCNKCETLRLIFLTDELIDIFKYVYSDFSGWKPEILSLLVCILWVQGFQKLKCLHCWVPGCWKSKLKVKLHFLRHLRRWIFTARKIYRMSHFSNFLETLTNTAHFYETLPKAQQTQPLSSLT